MSLKLKQLDPQAITPSKGSVDAACWDLYALEDTSFEPGEIKLVRTGWAAEPPPHWRLNIYSRSSTPIKKGFMLANSVGIIDNDYRGEIFVQLQNVKMEPSPSSLSDVVHVPNIVRKGERIAQMELVQHFTMHELEIVDELSDTVRGEGGIGSTGA